MAGSRKNPRLFSHIFWRVVPIAGLIMATFGYLAYASLERADMREVEDKLDEQSDHALDLILHPVQLLIAEAKDLAAHELVVSGFIDIGNRDTYLTPFFRSLRVHGPPGVEISLVDHHGRVIIANQAEPSVPSHWIASFQNKRTEIALTEDGVTITAPIIVGGQPEGVVILRYAQATLPVLFGLINYPLSTALIEKGGKVVFSSDENFAIAGTPLGEIDPETWLTVRQPLSGFDGITLIAAERTEDALKGVYEVRDILIATILGSLLMIIVTAGVAAFLASRETNRLGRMIRAIGGARDMHRRLEPTGPRELQELGKSFNTMLEILERETTSRAYFDSIVNSLSEVLLVSSLEGEILTANPAARRFLQQIGSPSENAFVNVMFAAKHFGVDSSPAAFVDWNSNVLTLEATYAIPHRETITVQWLRSILLDRTGTPMGIIFIGQDITERARIERLKNEFISTVNHELRTPLTSISGTLGLLKGGIAGKIPKKAQELIGIGLSNSDRLVHLINDLLDIQKIEAGGMEFRMKQVDLAEIAEASIKQNESLAIPRGIRFAFENMVGAAPLTADPDRLSQVMANFLSNAVKYSPENGVVTVTVMDSGDGPTVSVADDGPGIPEDFRERIFQRFAQADSSNTRKKGGTGLGLAIAQAIVLRHNGRIWYETETGKGTIFFFSVPAGIAMPAAARTEASPADTPPN